MRKSRLSKRIEGKTKKNLFLNIIGILVVIFIVSKFGIPLLANLSFFLSENKETQEQPKKNIFIAPPVLNPFPEATRSAEIIVSGIASPSQTINLYINDQLVDQTKTKKDGTFSFTPTISSGENTIKAKAIENKEESEFSRPLIIAFKSSNPGLNISSPKNDESFSKDQNTIDVEGTTDADVKIKINGFWAITDNSGHFSYILPLREGENKIKIVAEDPAGNKTEKEIKVTYNP